MYEGHRGMGAEMSNQQNINIQEIIDPKKLKKLLNSFVLATGLGAIFISTDGEYTIVPDDYEGICPFCKIVRGDAEGIQRCSLSMTKAGKLAAQLGEPYISRCHAGLIEFSAPIMFKDIYLGSISCGPVLMWDWDEIAVQEFLKQTEDLQLNREALVVASRQIKVLSGRNVQAAAELLFIMANSIAESGMITLQQRKELNEQEAKLAEAIFEKKKVQEKIKILEATNQKNRYPMEKERELLGRVRLGDRNGAREILNDLLGEIFFKTAGNYDVIKARILELVVVISRAAVEGGASLEKLLGLNFHFIEELYEVKQFDDICQWLIKVLDIIMDTVYETRNIKNAKCLGDVLTYIRENFKRNLSLENVAQQVFISPFYLSHLFKEELGITFVEYLTRVRIEAAKQLLKNSSETILAVSAQVGYEDASYFSKVFKKVTNISPNQYRKSI